MREQAHEVSVQVYTFLYIHSNSDVKLALLYNFTSVYKYTNIPSCWRNESKTSFPLQEGIFVYSRVFVQ